MTWVSKTHDFFLLRLFIAAPERRKIVEDTDWTGFVSTGPDRSSLNTADTSELNRTGYQWILMALLTMSC